MTPSAVIFDLGKVLLDFDFARAADNIARHSGKSAGEIQSLAIRSDVLTRYETGLMTSREFYEEVKALIGFTEDFELFARLFSDIFSPIESMIQLQATLAGQSVPTFILSNTNELAVNWIRAKYDFLANFTDTIFSFEHKSMKPDARLYEVVEEKTKCSGQALIYLDDIEENVRSASDRDWRVIHHTSFEKSRAALADSGLPV